MTWLGDRLGGGVNANDAVALRLAAEKRRRVLRILVLSNVVALIAVVAGCLFMMRSQGVQTDVARMRDEVGETLTMMSLGSAGEAVARYIPRLIDTTAKWDRDFAKRSESFRGLDAEIDHVQAMHRLGGIAERWRHEMEGIGPMQRNDYWQMNLKAQVEAEQKKWPNRMHQKSLSEWMGDYGRDFWYGIEFGTMWPIGIYARTAKVVKGEGGTSRLDAGDMMHYIFLPYRLSSFTMLRLAGIALVTTALGYLLCWLGMKSGLGWLSYAGLIYFLYLLVLAVFIVWLEVTK